MVRSLRYMTVLAFRADPWRALASLLVSALNSATGMAVAAYLVSRVVAAALSHDTGRALAFGVATGLVGVASYGLALVRLDLRFRMEEATELLIDGELIALTTGMPGIEHHERPEHLDRIELLRQQRSMLSGSVGAVIENVGTFGSIGTTIGLLASIDWRLLLLPLFGVPAVAASAVVRRWNHRLQETTAERGRLAEHLFLLGTSGPPAKELRVFGLRHELTRRYVTLLEEVHGEWDALAVRSSFTSMAGWVVFAVGYVGAIAFVIEKALHHQASAAQVVLAVTLAGQVNEQVSGVYWTVGWLLDSLKAVGRYLRLLDDAAVPTISLDVAADAPTALHDGIDLVDVSFRYPGTDAWVLRHVDLHLPAGSTVAIVGDNGAGKSTLVKLLSRFYEPTEGQVLVDSVDLRSIAPDEWRRRLSAGFQDFARFEVLAREAVGVGDLPRIDDAERVATALRDASAGDLATTLPAGLETQLGRMFDGGVDLSGGQWQKLALGRAMMRDAPLLLLLDEPTAALDADAEHALFERYARAAGAIAAESGGITLLVSHRFSTVRMADLIVVIGESGVAECGSHTELVALGGTYAELYELLARAYR
jgi:ATP-binding cassette subfamily B protein